MDWLLEHIPLWGWAIPAAGIVFAVWRFAGLRSALVAAGAVALVMLTGGAYRRGHKSATEKAEARRAREQAKAQQERINMRHEGDTARRDAEALTDEEARKEALKWSRR